MNALNLIGKDNFSALDGGVQLSIFNFIEDNSSANSSTMANFINSNSMSWITIQEVATQQSVFNYLIQNNFSSGSKIFMEDIIYLSINLEINAIDVWNNLQDYRSRMSQAELSIFDNLEPTKQIRYLAATKKALDKSQELFPNSMNNPCNLHNGKGDAFRHALWNGISSLLIGYDLTYSLTLAHEIGNTFIHQLQYKEKEMDLYNNNQGLSVAGFSNLFNIVQNIKDHCNLGFLRYLSNLDNNCFATYSSVLIPTNQ